MQSTDFSAKSSVRAKGMTLIELIIVLVIVALLVALAVPSFQAYVRKANRGDAQQMLMNWANNQEIWRSNNTTYAANLASPNGIPVPTHSAFTFAISNISATTYTLTATATPDQLKDKQFGTTCSPMTLNQSNVKTPADCW